MGKGRFVACVCVCVCLFPWCKYSHHLGFQAASMMSLHMEVKEICRRTQLYSLLTAQVQEVSQTSKAEVRDNVIN